MAAGALALGLALGTTLIPSPASAALPTATEPGASDVPGRVISWGGLGGVVPPTALSGVTAIAGGIGHALALKDGGVIAWGSDAFGQSTVPAEARSGVTAISAGSTHSLALKGGQVIAWGNNFSGQSSVPPAALSGVTAIAAGDLHSLGLKGGRVIVWGGNDYGQRNVPIQARSGVSAIATGAGHALALKDGRVITWGRNDTRQLDVPAATHSGIAAIAASFFGSLAIKADVAVTITGSRPRATAVVITGRTSQVALGARVSVYVREARAGRPFQEVASFPLAQGDATEGRFRVRFTGAERGIPYEAFAIVDGVTSNVIALSP